MNLVGGYPFSLIKNGLPFCYPALENSLETEVVIIGGGISGALAAYYLTNAGVACVIADSRTIGLGSTCASTSLLQYEIDTPLSVLKDKVGAKNAVTAYKLCEAAIDTIGKIDKKIKCGEYESRKSLYFASSPKQLPLLSDEFSIRKKNNFKVSYLNEEEINKEFGFIAPGAILSETAGQTDAYQFSHSLLQFACKKGLLVYDRTKVVSVEYNRRAVELSTENGFKIKARKLIYASGYETVNYLDKKIVDLHSTYATISEQSTKDIKLWDENVLMWNTADPYLYMRTTKDRRIIIGGRDESFATPGKRNRLLDKKTAQLKKDFENLFPNITYKPEFSWTGTFGTTKDGLPFIGILKNRPHSYFALGFGGNGIVFSVIAAEIITDLIVKGKSRYSNLFSFTRI